MSFTRRNLLQFAGYTALYSSLPFTGLFSRSAWANPQNADFLMPEESEHHQATWMAFGATVQAWGKTGNYGASRQIARRDLINIAANISRFEPVKMLVNDEQDLAEAQRLLAEISQGLKQSDGSTYQLDQVFSNGKALPAVEAGGKVEFILCPLNDLWARDTAPIFVKNTQGKVSAVDFNFNGWGQEDTGAKGWRKDPQKAQNGILDQVVSDDQQVAQFIINHTKVEKLHTWLVMEGGGIEVNGKGTAICTESCILNGNRNPDRSRAEIEQELHRLLGVQKVIWLKGRKAMDITDGHIDFYARFIDENTVVYAVEQNPDSPDYLVTQENHRLLAQATTAEGNKLRLVPLYNPDFDQVYQAVSARQWQSQKSKFNQESFAAGYIGFYVSDKFVLMAQFGDEQADKKAFDTLQQLYPTHQIMQIATDGLANGGGTIHCATQQQI